MLKIRLPSLATVAGGTLISVLLEQSFTALLFERGASNLVAAWTEGLVLGVLGLIPVLILLGRRLAPVEQFLHNPQCLDLSGRLKLRASLAGLPRFLFVANLSVFLFLPLGAWVYESLAGLPPKGPLDLVLIFALNLAFGFMASLQELGIIEAFALPVRKQLALSEVAEGRRELGLRQRLFLVNLGSVLLAALLAGMAALGFYREVVTYYTQLGADAVAAASTASTQAVSENELKVMGQLGLLFLAVLGWTSLLTTMTLTNVIRQLRTLEARVGQMADGSADLGSRAEVLFFDEVGSLTGRINAVMDRLHHVVDAIQTTSAQVLNSTSQVQTVSREAEVRLDAVLQARTQAEAALGGQGNALAATLGVARDLDVSSETVKTEAGAQSTAVALGASAMEQLAASVSSVRDLTTRADGLATSLRRTSEEGGQTVAAVRKAMEAIQEAGTAVAGTVASIKKTASQTNLLAMNAAIEAAHAGASGLGFAVVATEVRVLAESSSQGAKKIADLMRDMDSRIAEGDRLARAAGEAFSRIFGLIVETSEVMGTVSRAMDEQQAGTETLLSTTRTLREATLRIGSVTENQAAHAEELNRSVQILVETGASLAMAQEVQGRAMAELTGLVHTVAQEADRNSQAAGTLSQTVAGFTVGG